MVTCSDFTPSFSRKPGSVATIWSARILISAFHSAASFGCAFQNGGSGAPIMACARGLTTVGGRHADLFGGRAADAALKRECRARCHHECERKQREISRLHRSPPRCG